MVAVVRGATFEIKEKDKKEDVRPLDSRDSVCESSHLIICIPEGWFVEYDVIDKKGAKKKSGVLNAYVTLGPEGIMEPAESNEELPRLETAEVAVDERGVKEYTRPVSEDAKFGFGKEGDEIWFNAYEGAPGEEPKDTEFHKLGIVKKGWKLYTPDSFNLTPLFIFEIGKKKDPAGGKTNDFAPGAGVTYLLFKKDPKHKNWSNVGIGGNASFSKTRLVGEGEKSLETTGVATLGVVGAYKLPVETPIILQLVIGTNVTGTDHYLLIGGGIATPTGLQK